MFKEVIEKLAVYEPEAAEDMWKEWGWKDVSDDTMWTKLEEWQARLQV